MKKLLLLLLMSVILSLKAQSQSFCETPAISDYSESILETYNFIDFSEYKFCVRIYIHVVRKSDGTGGQSVSNVNDALGYVDAAYNPYDIFFSWDNNINYIDNTSYYNSPGSIMSVTTYDHTNGIDIYLFDDSTNHPVTGNGWGTAAGVGRYPAKLIGNGFYE